MILVTGASGFLGQHLVQRLSQTGQAIRAIYHQTKPSDNLLRLPHVTWQKADLLDVFDVEMIMQNARQVYHCAAIVSFDSADKYALLQVNTESTANIVNASLDAQVEKLAYVSSVASLGRSVTAKVITEETEWEESPHNSTYSKSKYYAEMEVWRGMAEGLNAVIINPGIILGEGDWEKGSAKLIKTADKEFPFYTEGINGWVDVKDVVEILVQLMNAPISEERFIVSAGNFSYKDIFTLMANALGKKPPQIKAGKFLTGLVWRWNALKSRITGERATITKETASTAQKQVLYDNTKLLEALSDFTYMPIRQTIERMATLYMKNK
ncbi:MAG TPA: NAD-dependent epimerase/dehydratase family protein [Flavipsychrobacter sp.]|nr:NAD-dependent epimerase/dehydratase family protein [Flavipsychrobacter sp.]